MADANQHSGILNKTLGEILQNNTQAQGMIMQSMQITPQQFQELLQKTGDNQMMNMKIGDLFKNGVMQQAMGQSKQVSPEQMQQIMGMVQQSQTSAGQQQTTPLITEPVQEANIISEEEKVPYTLPQPEKRSFFQKIKIFLRK